MATNISTFTYKGQDLELLYHKGKISYVFEIGDKRYGNAVKVAGKGSQHIIDASFALIINFIETYEAAKAKSK
jgi:hypothetical protein